MQGKISGHEYASADGLRSDVVLLVSNAKQFYGERSVLAAEAAVLLVGNF